jgi:phosphoribosylformylglycinamidine synthase subunit PurL
VSVDTVDGAQVTPGTLQPYGELGLTEPEYLRIRTILGRRPTSCELAMYSVMWSEHCSYKSSKVHLRQFGVDVPQEARDVLLVGIGENAGVVDVGDGYAVTFKIESHNHPSYVEPYQGAATGVGGIVRDILTMGARPVAILDPLRFGPADAADTRRVLPAVVAGIGGYGNCLGLPTIGGELAFDPSYAGNPLVNALCVGVMRHEDIKLARASGPGNLVVLFGAQTGGDGIGGVSVLASEAFGGGGAGSKRPSVQVGDPFTEKLLIECCLEIFAEDLVVGIQDLGGAGLSCATSELASAGDAGMRIELDRVPLRDASLAPEEILMSESQERMCAVVEPSKIDRFEQICARWGVTSTVIGEVTTGGRLQINWHGATVVDVPPRTVAHDGPVYERPVERPRDQDRIELDAPLPERLDRPADPDALRAAVLAVAGSPNLAGKSWVTDQYDRYVQGNTALSQPHDAGVIRIDEHTGLGVAVSTDGNGRFCRLDPYLGVQLAVAEAFRNVATSGARPLAVTNCLNFGSPEDPGVMWQFAETARGLADACRRLGMPVTGGNVSFYNQTGDVAILPTPIVGVLGVIDDVRRRTASGFGGAGDAIVLLGATRDEFGGSEWAHVVHDHLGGRPPAVDLDHERRLAGLLVELSAGGITTAAHDLADGGLAQGLVEMAVTGGAGARISLPDGTDPFVALLSESSGRVLITTAPEDSATVCERAARSGVPAVTIGTVGGSALGVAGLFAIPLEELRAVVESTLPDLFGS